MCFLLMASVPPLPSSWYTFLDLSLIGHFHHSSLSSNVPSLTPLFPHPYPVPPYHVTLLLFVYSIIITRTYCPFPFACLLFVSSTRIYTPWGQELLSALITTIPGGSDGKESARNEGVPGLIPGLGRSPGEGTGYPLQYSGLEDSMDRGAWQATYSTWLCKELDTIE